MDAPLLQIVEERLARADGPGHEWALLVLAACEGPEQLDRVLAGERPERPGQPGPGRTQPGPGGTQPAAKRSGRAAANQTAANQTGANQTAANQTAANQTAANQTAAATSTVASAPATVEPSEPLGAYLRSITVEGFRGVGARQTLNLQPGPGLTLVLGRNGSGKSSFAEGLEILLTGENWRWARRSKVWKEGWRNLHHRVKTEVAADIAVEGENGVTTITRTWANGADLTQGQVSLRLPSKAVKSDLSAPGWTQAMESYRPFLSYNELSAMFEGPTELHDRLSAILGLGQLDDAVRALAAARLQRERELKSAKSDLGPLLSRLGASEDPRASAAARALGSRTWDLAAAEAALGHDAGAPFDRTVTDELVVLRHLAALRIPAEEDVFALAAQLRDLIERQSALQGTAAGEARELAELLGAALEHHNRHGDGICPVCGRGPVNAEWRRRTEEKVADLREQATEADDLDRETRHALGRVPLILAPAPTVVEQAADVGLKRAIVVALQVAWERFASPPAGSLLDLADHLEATIEPLAIAAESVREEARHELDRREDAWRPLATELSRWLADASGAVARTTRTKDLKSAEDWLKQTTGAIRRERFEPIESRAIQHWAALRQQSSVELEHVMLEGTGSQRRVDLRVTVDGVQGAALGVMSQGELNAIALSLFLPRATLPESPFRFVVIDDPVQSMDPSRVDGLALVLADVAKTREVVVFTHDDRLREAVGRLDIEATIIEVVRREDSVVELRESSDPVRRHLDDAFGLAKTKELPAHIATQVVPGFCRSAIEAACSAVIRRRWIGRGEPHAKVEEVIAKARLTERLALAIWDDDRRAGDVGTQLQKWGDDYADAYGIANRGAHSGYRGSLLDLVRNTERLCVRLKGIA